MDLSGTQGELPIPMHATSPYVGLHHDHHGHHPNNGRSPSPPPAVAQHAHSFPSPVVAAGVAADESKKRVVGGIAIGGGAKFRECLKNHAASIGGNATDGCGEFMPNGEEGTIEALKCSACGCHRNFHRKELDHPEAARCDYTGRFRGRRHLVGYPPHAADPFAYPPRALALPLPLPPPPPHHMVMPLSAMQTSESDEMDGVGGSGSRPPTMAAKKRFRTKFTAEQKEKMLDFAEQVGWRLQRLDDGMVQQFCQEVGVKRRVLKVWMHNNKHNLAKKPPPPPSPPQPGEPIGSPSPPPLRLE